MRVIEIRASHALTPSGLPEYQYALNPYLGCYHGCRYCYARDFTGGDAGRRWGEVVYVKVNIPALLRSEVKVLRPGIVGISTITDPYQPVEAKYRITRSSLEILLPAGFHASIQTKSTFILKDADLLFVYRDRVDVGFTITTMDRDKARLLEPKAPPPEARAYALARISELGVRTWIFLGPLIKGLNDSAEDYRPVLELAKRTHSEVFVDRYRPRPGADAMLSALGISASADRSWWRSKTQEIKSECSALGVVCRTAEEEWRMYDKGRRRLEL